MTDNPYILISNDDGFFAPGLHLLVDSIKDFARLVIVAPDKKRSGSSMSITNRNDIELQFLEELSSHDISWYKCSGTPVDCIKVALSNLMMQSPVMVIGGINKGYNIGNESLYSGTVAIGIESLTKGIPALSFSFGNTQEDADYECCRPVVRKIVKFMLGISSNSTFLLNVNIPAMMNSHDIKICHQAKGHWDKEWTLMESIGDIRRYKRSGKFVRAMQDDTKSDIWALEHGFVSVVPLLSNLTDNQKIDTLKKLFE